MTGPFSCPLTVRHIVDKQSTLMANPNDYNLRHYEGMKMTKNNKLAKNYYKYIINTYINV